MRQAVQSVLAVVLGALLLCGCADYDDPYFVHSVYRPAVVADANIRVFYLTDRRYDARLPGGFANSRDGTPACGTVLTHIPPARLPKGAMIFATMENPVPQSCGAGERDLAAAVAREARKDGCASVLVWVHGFDTEFPTAAMRGAQLGLDTQWRCPVVTFSWTSSGRRTRYDADLANVRAAEPMLADLLRALSEAGLRADIVAHSMGTKLVLETLAKDAVPADQVVFAAPDIGIRPDDEFATLTRAAAPDFHRLTVYASQEDAVLAISRRLNGSVARLGREPQAAYRDALPHVDVIDASNVQGDYTGHNYYGLSYEIIADMALVLDDVPAQARLQPRPGAAPTLLPGEDGLPYRLNVADNRTPSSTVQLLRWLVGLIGG